MIKINQKLYMTHNKREWVLYEKVASKGDKKTNLKGEEIGIHKEDKFSVSGYFYNLTHLARRVVSLTDTSTCKDLKDLIKMYENIIQVIHKLLKEKSS